VTRVREDCIALLLGGAVIAVWPGDGKDPEALLGRRPRALCLEAGGAEPGHRGLPGPGDAIGL